MKAKFQACYLPILAEFAAKQDMRFYLNGFYIEPAHASAGGVYLIATDGHTAVVVWDKTGEADEVGLYPIPDTLLALAKKKRTEREIASMADRVIVIDGDMATFTHSVRGVSEDITVSCKRIDGKYPDVRRAICPDFERLVPVDGLTVNVRLIARLKKITKLDDGACFHGGMMANFRAYDKSSAIFCFPRLRDHYVYAVIMPMRDEEFIDKSWIERFRSMQWNSGDGWQHMKSAPTNASEVTVLMADGKQHERAHYACDLSGEDQPAFKGWFIPQSSGKGFQQIDMPVAWKEIVKVVPQEFPSAYEQAVTGAAYVYPIRMQMDEAREAA